MIDVQLGTKSSLTVPSGVEKMKEKEGVMDIFFFSLLGATVGSILGTFFGIFAVMRWGCDDDRL